MAIANGSWISAQGGAVLVPAQAGKIIRVVRIVVTTWATVKVQLQSDPGPDPLNLTAPLHVGAGHPLVLRLGRGGALTTERGKAFGMASAFQSGSAEYSVVVWYDVVT
jgi:hypothetical protein